MVAGGPGLVAVGQLDGVKAFWTSTNGQRWSLVSHQRPMGEAIFYSIAATSRGLVAVGDDFYTGGVVATSTDGQSWSLTEGGAFAQNVDGRFLGRFSVRSVVEAGQRLVAVGFLSEYPQSEAVVWTSEDQRTWTRIPNQSGLFGPSMTMADVALGPNGLVAVGGNARRGSPAVWVSPGT